MRLVIIESPFSPANGHLTQRSKAYALAAVLDCLERNESPIASHLLFTQVLDDQVQWEREMGIDAGLAWYRVAEACVVYTDLGISSGMHQGLRRAEEHGVPTEYRSIKWKDPTSGQEPLCDPAPAEELCGQGADGEARQADPGDETGQAVPGANQQAEENARVLTGGYLGLDRAAA